MKALICSVVVVLGLLSTAQAEAASPYGGYPAWARAAFENFGG